MTVSPSGPTSTPTYDFPGQNGLVWGCPHFRGPLFSAILWSDLDWWFAKDLDDSVSRLPQQLDLTRRLHDFHVFAA